MKEKILFFIPRFVTEWCFLSADCANGEHSVYPLSELKAGEKPDFVILISRFVMFNHSFFLRSLTDFIPLNEYQAINEVKNK